MSASPRAESSGNESAEQQLFAESQASPPKPRQPPTTSAIRSAHLLNAARVDKLRPASQPRSSSPPQVTTASIPADTPTHMAARNGGKGRLKRPSFLRGDMARNPLRNLARRGDVYEIDVESPQKHGGAPYELAETVNRTKPLKRVKKGNRVDDPAATLHPSSPSSAQPVRVVDEDEPPVVETEALRLSSPPSGTEPGAIHSAEREPRKSGRLAGKHAEVAHIEFGKQPERLPAQNTRSKRKATNKPPALERPSKSPRQENPDALEASITTSHVNEKPTSRPNPMVVISKPNPKKKIGGPGRGKKRVVLVADASEQKNSVETEPAASEKPSGRTVPATEPDSNIAARSRRKQTRSNTDLAKTTSSKRSRHAGPEHDATEEEVLKAIVWDSQRQAIGSQDNSQDAEVETEQRGMDESEAEEEGLKSAFEQVLAFTELQKRRGDCQTDEATRIKRFCRARKRLLEQPGTTLKEISTSLQELLAMLSDYGADEHSEERAQLKVDAYGYLFRELVMFLVQLHGWLERCFGEVSAALETMRILFALARAIVSFKDTIAAWKVQLPTRYKNDRLVKDVDVKLIAPLRRVLSSYRVTLSELKANSQARRMREEQKRKREEALEEERRKETSTNFQREKWNLWMDLHVWRQQCEPDPIRRRDLFIDPKLFAAKFGNSDERDANGFKFERIPLFKERDSPPHRPSAGAEEEWTDGQMAALVEGLTNFAGPNVFRQTFRRYCRPGGALRDFTVPELTAQAASVRSTLLAQYQGNNWEIPDWIMQIPVLP